MLSIGGALKMPSAFWSPGGESSRGKSGNAQRMPKWWLKPSACCTTSWWPSSMPMMTMGTAVLAMQTRSVGLAKGGMARGGRSLYNYLCSWNVRKPGTSHKWHAMCVTCSDSIFAVPQAVWLGSKMSCRPEKKKSCFVRLFCFVFLLSITFLINCMFAEQCKLVSVARWWCFFSPFITFLSICMLPSNFCKRCTMMLKGSWRENVLLSGWSVWITWMWTIFAIYFFSNLFLVFRHISRIVLV